MAQEIAQFAGKSTQPKKERCCDLQIKCIHYYLGGTFLPPLKYFASGFLNVIIVWVFFWFQVLHAFVKGYNVGLIISWRCCFISFSRRGSIWYLRGCADVTRAERSSEGWAGIDGSVTTRFALLAQPHFSLNYTIYTNFMCAVCLRR